MTELLWSVEFLVIGNGTGQTSYAGRNDRNSPTGSSLLVMEMVVTTRTSKNM